MRNGGYLGFAYNNCTMTGSGHSVFYVHIMGAPALPVSVEAPALSVSLSFTLSCI